MKRDWLRISLLAQVTLAIYFQSVQWLPLGRWNYQPHFVPLALQAVHGQLEPGDLVFVLAFALPVVLFYAGYRRQYRWLMWLCLAGYITWLALQVKTWWVAYIFGASDTWVEVYHRVFSQSTQLLPAFGRHLPPDAMHCTLDLLLLLIVFSLTAGLLRRRTATPPLTPERDKPASRPPQGKSF